MKKNDFVYLSGGLGNQLFQLSGAMSKSHKNFQIFTNSNNERVSQSNRLDIEDFSLPSRVIPNSHGFLSEFIQRALNLNLRNFANLEDGCRPSFPHEIARIACSIMLSLRLKTLVVLKVNRGLGYDKQCLGRRTWISYFYLGYFQSYKNLSDLKCFEYFYNLRLRIESTQLNEFQLLAEEERPLVVHVRLGDYKTATGFGIVGEEYFSRAFELITNGAKDRNIWLFSDEPNEAIELIPLEYRQAVRVIPQFEGNTALTLEVMRLGHDYIISNSTFSWWGASMSKVKKKQVVVPEPWFSEMTSPNELNSPEWLRLNPWK